MWEGRLEHPCSITSHKSHSRAARWQHPGSSDTRRGGGGNLSAAAAGQGGLTLSGVPPGPAPTTPAHTCRRMSTTCGASRVMAKGVPSCSGGGQRAHTGGTAGSTGGRARPVTRLGPAASRWLPPAHAAPSADQARPHPPTQRAPSRTALPTRGPAALPTSEANPSSGASVPLVSTTLCAAWATGRKATAGFMHHRHILKAKPGRKESSSPPPPPPPPPPLRGDGTGCWLAGRRIGTQKKVRAEAELVAIGVQQRHSRPDGASHTPRLPSSHRTQASRRLHPASTLLPPHHTQTHPAPRTCSCSGPWPGWGCSRSSAAPPGDSRGRHRRCPARMGRGGRGGGRGTRTAGSRREVGARGHRETEAAWRMTWRRNRHSILQAKRLVCWAGR